MAVRPFSAMPEVMKDRTDQIGDGITTLVRRVSAAIHRSVVLGTPVDKGVARSNWVVTRDVPFSSRIPAYAPGSKLGIGETANASAAISQGLAAIGRFDARRNRSIHFTNNVPYIVKLNGGSSRQAPALFVQRAIAEGAASIRGVRLLKR